MSTSRFRSALLAATMGLICFPAAAQAPGSVTVLSADAAIAADKAATDARAALQRQVDALTARVTSLERGQPPIPPSAESPDGTKVMATDPSARIVDGAGNRYGILVSKITMNDVPVMDTGAVVELRKIDHPADGVTPGGVFQRNSVNQWYGPVTAASGGPSRPGDPSVRGTTPPIPPIPPSSGGAPAPAAGVGFNVATAKGPIVMGSSPANWRLWDGRATVVTNGDGTVTVQTGGSNGYNSHIVTAVPSNGDFLGKTFKGSCGGYYAMQLSFPGTATMNNGWPAFWANDIENQISQGGGLAHWPGQANGYVTSIEVDVMEHMTGAGSYGGALHHWYGAGPYPATNTEGSGSPFPYSGNTADRHWYGGLHVPATANSKGYFEWYFDHRKVGNRISWDKYNQNNGPPPRDGSTAYAVMDERNLYWIAGSGPSNPMTIYDFQAWQPRADCTTSR